MVRDFTNAAKQKLLEKIDQVNEEQLCGFTDMLGDAGLYIQEYTGFLDVENYKNKVSKYHKKVLDQHDSDKKDIERIFSNVQEADDLYKSKIEGICENFALLTRKLTALENLINPASGGTFSPAAVSGACKGLNTEINSAMQQLTVELDDEIVYAQKIAAKEAAKNLVGDIFGVGSEVADFCLNLLEGDLVGATLNMWGTVDKSFAMFQDSTALLMVGMTCVQGAAIYIGADDEKMRRYQMDYLTESKDYQSREGFADEFDEDTGFGKFIHKASDTVNVGKDVYGVYKSGKRFKDSAKKVYTAIKDGRYNTGNRIGEVIFSELGFKTEISGKDDTLKVVFNPSSELEVSKYSLWKNGENAKKVYRKISRDKSVISNVKTLWGFAETAMFDDGEYADNVVNNTSSGGFISSCIKAGEGILEYFTVEEIRRLD